MKELKGENNKVVTIVSDKQKKKDEVVKFYIDRLHYFMKTPMEEWPQVRFGSGILYIMSVGLICGEVPTGSNNPAS